MFGVGGVAVYEEACEGGEEDGEEHEGRVFDDVAAARVLDTEHAAPGPPVGALGVAVGAPAAERATEVELPAVCDVAADALLEIAHPVTRNINARCDAADGYPRRDEDPPNLAGVCGALEVAEETMRGGCEVPEPRALFGVLVDPVDGGQVVVAADAASGAFGVPVHVVLALGDVGAAVGLGAGGRVDGIAGGAAGGGAEAIA